MMVSGMNDEPMPCSLARRAAAMVYDGLVVVAIWMVGAAAVVIPAGAGIAGGNPLFQLYLLALAFGYFHSSWRLVGQTLGMRAWRVWLDPGPRPFGAGRGLARFAAGAASLVTLGLGYFWALGRDDHRAWPDLASGSRLVHRPAGSAAQ